MVKLVKIVITLLLCIIFYPICYATENAFYILRSNQPSEITTTQNELTSLNNHFKSINLLISQAYQIDHNGMVWGFVNPDVVEFVNKHQMKLMAMVTNAGFDKEKVHRFLANPAAQKRAVNGLLQVCKENHYYGVQMDFEMVPLNDRDGLTQFYRTVAEALHKQGLIVSFAVAPLLSDSPQSSDFLKKIYENWEGAYDLKALGECSDFLTLMTYNQHGSGTTPGPTASVQWMDAVLKYALSIVPPQKISLGIPSYSGYWFTTKNSETQKISVSLAGIGYGKVKYLLNKYHANVQWDDTNKNNFAVYQHDWLNEYLFIEDAKSFKAKLDLVKKYNLRGISVFSIGIEDPNIWVLLF